MGKRLNLALFIGSLEGGGAQRIACLLANFWVEAGHTVTVYHNDHAHEVFPFTQAEAVKLRRLPMNVPVANRAMALVRLVRDTFTLRRNILTARHDAVVSFLPQANVLALLACLGTKVPVVITELCHPGHESLGSFWNLLRRLTYPRSNAFIVQTKDIYDWFLARTGLSPVIIPNPVPKPTATRKAGPLKDRKIVMTAARLTYQKNLASLAGAFVRLAGKHPDWDLDIYGLGEDQKQLEAIIHDSGLHGRIRLRGWTSELCLRLAEADMFVLSSRFEGMPMALAEAMSMGVPCISTDCPSGPADYITSGENGVLVPVDDTDALAEAMDALMSDAQYRAKLGCKAMDISQRFSSEAVFALWDACLNDVAGAQ